MPEAISRKKLMPLHRKRAHAQWECSRVWVLESCRSQTSQRGRLPSFGQDRAARVRRLARSRALRRGGLAGRGEFKSPCFRGRVVGVGHPERIRVLAVGRRAATGQDRKSRTTKSFPHSHSLRRRASRDDSTNIETRAISDRVDPLLELVAGLDARLATKVPRKPFVRPPIYFRL